MKMQTGAPIQQIVAVFGGDGDKSRGGGHETPLFEVEEGLVAAVVVHGFQPQVPQHGQLKQDGQRGKAVS